MESATPLALDPEALAADNERLRAELDRANAALASCRTVLQGTYDLLRSLTRRSPHPAVSAHLSVLESVLEDPTGRPAVDRIRVIALHTFARDVFEAAGEKATATDIVRHLEDRLQTESRCLYSQGKVLDLAGGFELHAAPDGHSLFLDAAKSHFFAPTYAQAGQWLSQVREWLNSAEGRRRAPAGHWSWRAAVDAEQRLRTAIEAGDPQRYVVAFESTQFAGGVWLKPPDGVPLDVAEQIKARMEHRRPDLKHWIEPQTRPETVLRLETGAGMTLYVNHIEMKGEAVDYLEQAAAAHGETLDYLEGKPVSVARPARVN